MIKRVDRIPVVNDPNRSRVVASSNTGIADATGLRNHHDLPRVWRNFTLNVCRPNVRSDEPPSADKALPVILEDGYRGLLKGSPCPAPTTDDSTSER